jgi:hypothetical protein
MHFAFLGATKDYIGVLVSNSGDRPGSLQGARLHASGDSTGPSVLLAIVGLASNATQIIDAGANTQVNFSKGSDFNFYSKGTCAITLFYKNFVGPERDTTLEAPCSNFYPFFVPH